MPRIFEPPFIFIIIAVALLLFGAPKLPAMARSLGQSMRIFKSEVKQMKDDDASPADRPEGSENYPGAQQNQQGQFNQQSQPVNGGAPQQPAQPQQQQPQPVQPAPSANGAHPTQPAAAQQPFGAEQGSNPSGTGTTGGNVSR